MLKKFISGFFLISTCLSLFAGELEGNYSAVTESEEEILINLKPNNTGEFIVGVYAIEDDEKDWRKTENIEWSIFDKKLFIEFESNKHMKYQVVECHSYNEFGKKGCSFGLKPIGGSFIKNDSIMRNSLWKTKELKKLWK